MRGPKSGRTVVAMAPVNIYIIYTEKRETTTVHTTKLNNYKNIPTRSSGRRHFQGESRVKKAIKRRAIWLPHKPPPSTSSKSGRSHRFSIYSTLSLAFIFLSIICVCVTCASACDSTFLPTSSARKAGKYFVMSWPRRRRDTLAPLVLNNKRAAVCYINIRKICCTGC